VAAEVNKADLQRLADEKLADAQSLLNAGRWSNAYYLGGYAVEMAIKACIAKAFKVETIPDKDLVLDTYTHKFPKLVGTAGLAADLRNKEQADQVFAANWGVANEWSPDSRYQTTSEQDARELLEAIGEPNHGVLAWIRTHW
jgi:HEPN domain-containing protein